MDVCTWLRGLGLERYEQTFLANDIDMDVLADLTADDLSGLGIVSIGHRRKILAAIAALRNSASPSPRSIPLETGGTNPALTAGPALPEGERRQVTVLFADL